MFIDVLNRDIIPAIQQGAKIYFTVLSVQNLSSDTLIEATFKLELGNGTSDTKVEIPKMILKKINNKWYLYGNQNDFGAMVFTELNVDNELRLYFKLDFDDNELVVDGDKYDSSAIQYARVHYNSNLISLVGRQDGSRAVFDTYITIQNFPITNTEYNFILKLNNNDTIFTATAKFIKGISTPLIITKPVAYSVNDSTGQFVWTLTDTSQNALIERINISINAGGNTPFNYNESIEKENENQTLTSYNANINYTNRSPHNLYLSVNDDNDNRVNANIIYFPLPGDGSINGVFTFSTNATNATSLNNKKIYLYLTTWANNAEITTDSQMFTLNLNALNVSNNFNYSFNNLFYTNYSLKTFIDLNDNNQYDAGEPNYSLGNYVIEEANKNVITNS